MKKAVLILAAVAALLVGLLIHQRLREGPPDPALFMTRALSGDLEVSLRSPDGAALGAWASPALEALAGGLEGDDPLPGLLVLKFGDVLSHLGPFSVRLALSGDGTARLEGAYAVTSREPEPLVRGLLLQAAAAHSGLALESFALDLPHVSPLGVLKDEKRLLATYFALWEDRGRALLLAASTPEVLAAMVEAAGDEARRHPVDAPPAGLVDIALSLSPALVEAEPLFASRPLPEGSRLLLSVAFDRQGGDGLVRLKTNAWDLLATEAERGGSLPLGEISPLVGGGSPLAVAAGRLRNVDFGGVADLLSRAGGEEGADEIASFLDGLFHLTREERESLFAGPVVAVVGGRAHSPLGETPGFYLLLHPSRPDLAETLLERVLSLPQPIPFGDVTAEGWSRAATLQAFADVTVAADPKRLLLGILDPAGLALPVEETGPFREPLDPDGYGGFYLSTARLDEALTPLLLRLAPLDDRLARAAQLLEVIAEKIEAFSLRFLSPGEALLRVLSRSGGA